jgi:DmsE family decaheme c-type cytochrome
MAARRSSRLARLMLNIRAGALIGAVCLLPLWAQQQKSAPADAPAFVGSETCQTCHEDLFTAFQKNPHHVVELASRGRWKGQACESCHGPGGKHAESTSAEDILSPERLSGVSADKSCLACHLNKTSHSGRILGSHARGQVKCATCHPVHRNGPNGMVTRKPRQVNEQCTTCHTTAWAEFRKPHAHRLPEGAMSCIDCHNPHGTINPRQVRTFAANEPGCLNCHSDKRGPFTFEHAPMRFEGCQSCHQPHGSTNPRMLTRHEVRFVCLECHSNLGVPATALGQTTALGNVPPAFHDLRSPRFQNCTICHQKVHGSHVDRNFLR